jgi:hypothetical protein
MKIYTYHEFLPQIPNGHRLLDFWKASWEREGWTPVVLDRSHAEQHANYSEFLERYKNLPSVNPPGYELACYLRWLAMAVVGGGWMSDSDVIPYGFKPNDYPTDALTIWSRGTGACPCLVSGTVEHYSQTAKVFADWSGETNFENGRPHASDQNILGKVDRFYNNIQICSQYGETDWDSCAVVHYPNSSMRGKQPREEHIPLLRTLD